MSGHRQAALALFPLHPGDQNMILAELADEDRTILRAHLEELRELGFDEHALSDSVTARPPVPAVAATTVARIQRASAAAMFGVLADEPATLIAQFLQFESWPWAPDMLCLFPPQRRALVRAAFNSDAEPCAARRNAMIELVAAALEAAPPAPAADRGSRPFWRRLSWPR